MDALTNVYKKDPTGTRHLVVKNVTTKYDEEYLQLYFEHICKCDVLEVTKVDTHSDLLLVEFSEAINDIDSVRRRVQEGRFKGIVPDIDYLGCPSGLYIKDMRTNVSKDMLELKFENKRSGGVDECVESVEFVHVGSRKHACVQINNNRALASILSIDVHQIENAVLQLQPYYPSIHNDVWAKLKTENCTKGSEATGTVEEQEQKKASEASGRRQYQLKRPPRKSKITHSKSSSDGETETGNEKLTNLRMFYENSDNQTNPVPDTSTFVTHADEASSSHQSRHNDTNTSSHGSRNMQKRHRRRNMKQRTHSCSRTQTKQVDRVVDEENTKQDVQEEMKLSSAKIALLIIFRFQSKNSDRGFTVQFQERNEKVIIKGNDENDVTEAKLKMHECLNLAVSLSRPLTLNQHRFLSRLESKNCIRERSKLKKCFASYELQDSPPEFFCHAFNLQQCRDALAFAFNEIQVRYVELGPEHDTQQFEESMKSFIEDLDTGLTTVYVDKSHKAKVVIESFLESKAEDARRKIKKFLDNHTPREKHEVVLEGARARCFETCLKSQLKRTILTLSGRLDLMNLSRDPLKICVAVEGCQQVIAALKRTVLRLCCEEVDFQKIKKGKTEELWLIYKGLNSPRGKDFVRQFETIHKCFIDVLQSGVLVLPPKRSKVFAKRLSPTMPDSVDSRCSSSASSASARKEQTHMFSKLMDDAVFDRNITPLMAQPNLLARQNSTPLVSNIHRLKIGGLSVTLKKGQIVNEMADALVNIVSSNHSMGESVLSKEFVKKAGSELVLILKQEKLSCQDERRFVIATDSAGMKNCSTILHVALRKGEAYCTSDVAAAMKEILDLCESRSCKSVAIPPLGVGRMYKYPPETVIKAMLAAIKKSGTRRILQTVTFVTYDQDTHSVFENEFQSLTTQSSQPMRPNFQLGRVSSDLHALYSYGTRLSTSEEVTPRLSSANSQGFMSPRTKPANAPKPTVCVSRFPDDKPIAHLQVHVIHVGDTDDNKAARDLVKEVEEEFLHEEILAKTTVISKETKQKIVDNLVSHDVKSFKVGDKYVFKGQKENVNAAYKEVLQILLDDKESSKRVLKQSPRGRPGTTEYVSDMIDSEPAVPKHWKLFKSGSIIKTVLKEGRNDRVRKITLRNTSPAYQAIHQMFQSNIELNKVGLGQDAVGITYTRLNIIEIQRIENVNLYEQFARKRIELYQKLHSAGMVGFPKIKNLRNCSGQIETAQYMDFVQDTHEGLNEFLLFHGTKPELTEVICNGGFDERRGSGRAMFGQGIYGAEKSMKADQYTDSKHGRITGQGQMKYMFLMRMMLGNSYLCTNNNPPKYCRPPCTTCQDDKCNNHDHVGPLGHLYDSVTGDNGKLFREFVVYDRSLCYPEYLITYERI